MQSPDGRLDNIAAGSNLRSLRERLGLTMREVESASERIAERHRNDEFSVSPSRLSDIETKGLIPSIFRLYSLAVIYRCDVREVLSWYGIDLSLSAADLDLNLPPRSHVTETLQGAFAVEIPIRLDPAFDPRRSANLSRMVEQWGLVPLAYLAKFSGRKYTYGYIGSEDFTMYPLLPPGTFLQVDESRTKILSGMWRSELERPIYFVETREGYTCSWCSLKGDQITLQPHPLSPVAVRILRHPQEAEVIGRVVGIALKLGEWLPVESLPDSKPAPKERAALN
ncbi:MAG TPA: helix-turn-helix transcriptional regulator [Terriglobales bacterium]|jgi:transcriptional regulator with XRE-family HTH domain|nr:helix-turn-helix transcriptional regulator [Terriglobales bacterium]